MTTRKIRGKETLFEGREQGEFGYLQKVFQKTLLFIWMRLE